MKNTLLIAIVKQITSEFIDLSCHFLSQQFLQLSGTFHTDNAHSRRSCCRRILHSRWRWRKEIKNTRLFPYRFMVCVGMRERERGQKLGPGFGAKTLTTFPHKRSYSCMCWTSCSQNDQTETLIRIHLFQNRDTFFGFLLVNFWWFFGCCLSEKCLLVLYR